MITDWVAQLDFTTKIFRARGLHLDDRQVRHRDGRGFSASIVDAALYVVNNHARLRARRIVAGAVPAEDPDRRRSRRLARDPLRARAATLGLPAGSIKTYVLVEQIEACFQLMEIRAALAPRFVGFNTGRWDYINSVSDAMAWDDRLRQPEHRRDHDDLRLHADLRGPRPPRRQHAGSPRTVMRSGRAGWNRTSRSDRQPGVAAGMKRAVAGAEREQREGASGKWVAHWKMVHIVRPVWEQVGAANQLGRAFPPLTYTDSRRRRPDGRSSRRREPNEARATCSASASSTATRSARECRRPP